MMIDGRQAEHTVSHKNKRCDSVKVWARVTRGLEWIAAAEVSMLPGINDITTGHRNLFFSCQDFEQVNSLRCIDDAFMIWQELTEIDHTRLALEIIGRKLQELSKNPCQMTAGFQNLRVTASVLGQSNYSRFEIEDKVGEILGQQLRLTYLNHESVELPNTLWCRFHLSNGRALVGFRSKSVPLHRRYWRRQRIQRCASSACSRRDGITG